MKFFLKCLVFLTVGILSAQNSFVIKDVTLFDGEQVITKTHIEIEDGKVVAIGDKVDTTLKVIDGNGKFLMPAMTNSHVHAFMPNSLTEAAQAGVLNLFDMHGMEPMQGFMKSQKDAPDVARLFVAGYAATAPEGHGTQFGFPVPTLEKPEDAEQWVADRVKAGVDHIKIIVEPWKKTISHETAKEIIKEGHAHNKVVVVHISKANDAHKVLVNGANGLVHLWWDIALSDIQLKEIAAQEGIFVIPTVLTTQLMQSQMIGIKGKALEASKNLMLSEIKRLHDAGIEILAGTDPPNANINMGTDLYKELNYLSEAGIPALDVLKSATSLPAEKFKLKELGFLKVGYKADMILLDANPLDEIMNIEKINTIWKEGVVVKR